MCVTYPFTLLFQESQWGGDLAVADAHYVDGSALRRRSSHAYIVTCQNSLKRFSARVPNQTDDRFSDLDRAFQVREVANAFEQEPVISPGKKPLP
jgi:hypothetical protein